MAKNRHIRYTTLIPEERLSRRQRASVDPDGTIILPSEEANSVNPAPCAQRPTPNPIPHSHPPPAPRLSSILRDMRLTGVAQTGIFVQETARQYRWCARSVFETACRTGPALTGSARNVWTFLTQPVWITRPRREPKRTSRLSLFLVDTVRFGGTFAALFGLLFAALNYQSFWEIVQARIDPLRQIKAQITLGQGVPAALSAKLLTSPAWTTANQRGSDLLGFLPPVGPPENRLIIPKLNLNVPIVVPSIDALLKEDWTQVEADIQNALEEGVVHYPGTAKPGQAGNFFITGHSSYYPWASGEYKTVFARLHDLAAGDEYWVYYNGDKHRYVVRGSQEVKPANVDVLDQPIDRRVSTLMTCTPVGTTLRRLIISADEVDLVTGEVMSVGQQPVRGQQRVKLEMLPI